MGGLAGDRAVGDGGGREGRRGVALLLYSIAGGGWCFFFFFFFDPFLPPCLAHAQGGVGCGEFLRVALHSSGVCPDLVFTRGGRRRHDEEDPQAEDKEGLSEGGREGGGREGAREGGRER